MDKKIVALVALAGLTLGGTLAHGVDYSAPGSGIVGSKHDMTKIPEAGATKLDEQGRVCAFCHTPHHKLTDVSLSYNPLWSHDISKDMDWSKKTYQSVTFDRQGTMNADPLIGPSRLCMSCHDGIIAVDQHYGSTATKLSPTPTRFTGDGFGDIAIGKDRDLSNDHPIGFELGGINSKDPGIRAKLVGGTFGGKDIETLGFNDGSKIWMTCQSCHDVHNKDNQDSAFLYAPQSGSQFCLMCHDK